MLTTSVDDALKDLRTGYCLWIGAGVGTYIGAAADTAVPGWGVVVDHLEAAAGLKPPPGTESKFTDRIERCLRALRRVEFQRALRGEIVRPLAEAIVKLANEHVSKTPCLPDPVRRLAHLGSLANPIVNFNVETTTSRLIADPSGHSNIRCFVPSVPGASTLNRGSPPPTWVFRRNVYHPHGAVDDSGISVMASSDYETMPGTLSLQLAVHNAFENKLAIVGMSLDDLYLREQIRSFRRQIDTIYWFVNADTAAKNEAWAWENNVTLVEQPWSLFWNRVEEALPGPIQEERLYQTWLIMVLEAFHELFGRSHTDRSTAIRLHGHTSKGEPVDPAIVEEWRALARARGETGDVDLDAADAIKIPVEAVEATEAIRQGMRSASRIDRFCREVAKTDTVFFAWERSDKLLAIQRAPEAREFWSTRELAETALGVRRLADRFRAVETRWGAVSEPWWRSPPSLTVSLDGMGDPATAVEVRASRLPVKVSAIRSW